MEVPNWNLGRLPVPPGSPILELRPVPSPVRHGYPNLKNTRGTAGADPWYRDLTVGLRSGVISCTFTFLARKIPPTNKVKQRSIVWLPSINYDIADFYPSKKLLTIESYYNRNVKYFEVFEKFEGQIIRYSQVFYSPVWIAGYFPLSVTCGVFATLHFTPDVNPLESLKFCAACLSQQFIWYR